MVARILITVKVIVLLLSFERETGKWSGWKELAGICEFGETGEDSEW